MMLWMDVKKDDLERINEVTEASFLRSHSYGYKKREWDFTVRSTGWFKCVMCVSIQGVHYCIHT